MNGRGGSIENLEAYDLYLRALPHMASVMPADARIAKALLENALKKDPNYAAAHALIAWCHEILMRSSDNAGERDAGRAAGLEHARAAIASGTDDAAALAIAANVIVHLGKDDGTALSAIERALALNARRRRRIILAPTSTPTAATPRSRPSSPTARCG